MAEHTTPDQDPQLKDRIHLVRRDLGSLLFHFTRSKGRETAFDIILRILRDRNLRGSGYWTGGEPCVSFTEAPIAEFTAVFSLVQLASSANERPRYEPYGIAVSRDWLFRKGGRPAIYDKKSSVDSYGKDQRYRLVPFDPDAGLDFTWEREWRIRTDSLELEPESTLVVVPTTTEAFDLMDRSVPPYKGEGSTGGGDTARQFSRPEWMAVSLDVFGIKILPDRAKTA